MTAEEQALLAKQGATVAALLKSHYGAGATLQRTRADLPLLQRLIDDQVVRRDQTYELQCLGTVLGNVLTSETPLRWAMADDQRGREPVLQYQDASFQVLPWKLLAQPLQQAERVQIEKIFDVVVKLTRAAAAAAQLRESERELFGKDRKANDGP